MSADNSTSDNIPSNTSTLDITTKTLIFFDPSWELAMTIEFYFQYIVIAIGVFGAVANALILYALIAHHLGESKKRAINLLMINQNLLDLSSCLLLIVTFSVRVSSIYLTGALGYFLCVILISENATQSTVYASIINITTACTRILFAFYQEFNFTQTTLLMKFTLATTYSIINLMAITVERYLKVVYPFWSKKNLKRWVIYAAMVFAWIGGPASVAPVVFISTIVKDGVCLSYFVWENEVIMNFIQAWSLITYFFVPVIVFVFCYGRIVVVMRRQIRVMAAHNVEGSAQTNVSKIQSKRLKWNIVKTMIIVSVAFVICWFPTAFYFIIVDNTIQAASDMFAGYSATVILSYLYICMNPFIYAIKHEGVKEKLTGLVVWCKRVGVLAVANETGSKIAGGTEHAQRPHAGTTLTK